MKRIARTLGDREQWAGFERWAAGLASTALGSWGVRRGGWVGLLAVAGAGLLAFRVGARESMLEKLVPTAAKPEPPRALEAPKPVKRAAPRVRAASASAAARAKAASSSKRKTPESSAASQSPSKTAPRKRTNGAAAKPIPLARSRAAKPALSS
ncbi:MAG: hypothetical protein AB1592_14385 [Pseudomonadota bacterium]